MHARGVFPRKRAPHHSTQQCAATHKRAPLNTEFSSPSIILYTGRKRAGARGGVSWNHPKHQHTTRGAASAGITRSFSARARANDHQLESPEASEPYSKTHTQYQTHTQKDLNTSCFSPEWVSCRSLVSSCVACTHARDDLRHGTKARDDFGGCARRFFTPPRLNPVSG